MRDLYTNLIAYVRSLVGNKVGINENAHEDREMFTHPWDQSKARRRVFLLEIANHLSVAFYCIKQPTGNGPGQVSDQQGPMYFISDSQESLNLEIVQNSVAQALVPSPVYAYLRHILKAYERLMMAQRSRWYVSKVMYIRWMRKNVKKIKKQGYWIFACEPMSTYVVGRSLDTCSSPIGTRPSMPTCMQI
ncbi:hypothetical protein P167DRAFT_564348 [Morchella conica CCBAS932]|uniref:Uncharacterized protein n=1 Tax=Morchella conica CCBAS932 TaxID=1392247 RepID=A0A3N4L758_9PEZI|nr:hypothetical protein P167DRAFT_564348 [Morchella conica CCBAS932]